MAVRVGSALVINPGSAGEPRDHRIGFRLSAAVLDTGEVAFYHYDDPTRPQRSTPTSPRPTCTATSVSNEPSWLQVACCPTS
jgi:hypothetical protein